MPVGTIVLLAVAALIFFGLAERVLDRMHLTDKEALIFLGLLIAGSFIDIPLAGDGAEYSVNVGGALVPVALSIYLLARAGTNWERIRALLAAVATAGVVYGLSRLMTRPGHTEDFIIDPVWLFSLVGGIVGYIFGRSRRAAFVAGTLGILITDLVRMVVAIVGNHKWTVSIGGAGAFDQIVLAGVVAVILADLFGESRERLQGGPRHSKDRPTALDNEEFVHNLTGKYPGETTTDESTDKGERGGDNGKNS